MIEQLLEAVRELILTAPGNDDEQAGTLWESPIERLGAVDQDDAENRVYFDLFEAEELSPERPFFVIVDSDITWNTHGSNAWSTSQIDVFFSERAHDPEATDPDAPVGTGAAHNRSKLYFAGWVGHLIADCADRIGGDSPLKVDRIEQLVPAQRTPLEQRDPDDPSRDYWWTCWRFHVGTGNM